MRPSNDLNSFAIHEAGHVAACINLGLEFDHVYLKPPGNYPGLVSSLVRAADIDYSSGVLTPEEESLSTNLFIIAFAGPAFETLHAGRASFDMMDYDDLDEVLDSIEERFSNNGVRMTFTRYCEAEAYALFEDDRRLSRFANLLAKELSRQNKLSYAQCLELYSKEYLAESWVRKEVEEIRRSGETEAQKIEDRVERQEQRAAGRPGKQEGAKGHKDQQTGQQKPPVQDREAPKHEAAVKEAVVEGSHPAEAGGAQQGERRGRRRRRGRGRGRGKRRETLEQLPGEIIGGHLAGEATGEELHPDRNVRGEQEFPKEGAVQKAEALSAKTQEVSRKAEPQLNVPVQTGETPREERVKKQVIKAVKPPVQQELPKLAAEPKAAAAVTPPVAEQRPAPAPKAAEQRPVETPPVVLQEAKPAAAGQPKRRPAVSGGPKAEGKAVSGGKGTTHPDSIWEEEKKPVPKLQASGLVAEQQQTPGSTVKVEGKKPVKAAKPRTAKAAKVLAPVAETAGAQKKAVTPTPQIPAGQKKVPGEPKSAKAKPAKAAKAPPKARSAAKSAKSESTEPKPETPKKRGGGRKKAAE